MSKFLKTAAAVGLILSVFSSPLALAENEQKMMKGPPPFSDFDRDGSGAVSEDEFNLTRGERHAAMAEAGKPMKGMATAPSFADVDSDSNGQLSEAELTAAQQAHMKQVHGDMKGHGKGKGKGGCKGKAAAEDQAET